MTTTRVLLGLVVLSTGLFAGLLMTVLFFFERALKNLTGPEFALVVRRFLEITRTHPLNYALVLTSGILPVAVLVLLSGDPAASSFLLTAIGLLAFWCGSILPSTFVAEPLYGVFLGWEIAAPPKDWQDARDRYFRLNVIRGLGSALAFVLFVIAAMLVPQ